MEMIWNLALGFAAIVLILSVIFLGLLGIFIGAVFYLLLKILWIFVKPALIILLIVVGAALVIGGIIWLICAIVEHVQYKRYLKGKSK